jgi:hypothetical protein
MSEVSRKWTAVSGPRHTCLTEIPLSNRFGVEARWNQDGCSFLYAIESDNEWGFAWKSCRYVMDDRLVWDLPSGSRPHPLDRKDQNDHISRT